MNINKANSILLELAEKYQHVTYKDIVVPVPYFINIAEQVYKQAMSDAGIADETISKVMQLIKDGKTPLGVGRGKGSPEEITQDLARLMDYLIKQGYDPNEPVFVRNWMTEMHIGLDCSGYVYNILHSIENNLGEPILKKLAWENSEEMKSSHAGVFVFDSMNLKEITEHNSLKPLDLLIAKDHTHVGILAEHQNNLSVTDCSMGENGISFHKIVQGHKRLEVENSTYWTKLLNDHELIVRRLS